MSVSKLHAKLTVGLSKGQGKPEVVLEDIGSKFGTHMNSGILSESQVHHSFRPLTFPFSV